MAFTVAATDADSDTLTYSWDFGDGSAASTQQNPTHSYTTAGTYTAKVTVSDGKGGTATKSFPVTRHPGLDHHAGRCRRRTCRSCSR